MQSNMMSNNQQNILPQSYGQQQQGFGQNPATANAYYDKPADQRLAPWIIFGSLVLALLGLAMIITSVVHQGHISIVWGLFISGLLLAAASIFGIIAGVTRRPTLAYIFLIVLALAFLGSLALLIVNAAFLNHNMNNRCQNINAPRYSQGCDNVRSYNIVIYSVFGALVALWVPTLLIAANNFARTCRIYRKQEGNGGQTGQQMAPVGGSRM